MKNILNDLLFAFMITVIFLFFYSGYVSIKNSYLGTYHPNANQLKRQKNLLKWTKEYDDQQKIHDQYFNNADHSL